MHDRLAIHILDTIKLSLKLHVGSVQYLHADGRLLWRVDARNNDGERWAAEDEDLYKASVMLAELVGFDLEE